MSDEYDNVTFLPFGKRQHAADDELVVDDTIMQKIEMNLEIFDAASETEQIVKGILFSVTAAIEERIPISDRETFLQHMSAISCLYFGAMMYQRQVGCVETELLNSLVDTLEVKDPEGNKQ